MTLYNSPLAFVHNDNEQNEYILNMVFDCSTTVSPLWIFII